MGERWSIKAERKTKFGQGVSRIQIDQKMVIFGKVLLLLCLFSIALNALGQNLTASRGGGMDAGREGRCQRARQFVDKLNLQEIGDGRWKAIYRERFAAMNETRRRRMHGLINVALPNFSRNSTNLKSNSSSNGNNQTSSSSIRGKRAAAVTCTYSYAFDARTQWPSCAPIIGNIRDQSACGGCWAVASASVFTDRYCILRSKAGVTTSATNASNFFSEADVLSCSPSSYGCDGGSPYYAFYYMKNSGVVTGTNNTWSSGCKPYPFPANSNSLYSAPSCASSCTNAKWPTKYSADKKYASTTGFMQGTSTTVAAIQAEIKANGPVVASMYVYDDFYYYSSGVYKRTSSTYEGGHAIRLLGWGTQSCSDGTKQAFWLAANSWNTDWGMNGLFHIAQGTDESNIESLGIFYGNPKI